MTHADIAPVLNAVFSSDDEALPFDEKFELMNNLDEGVREAAWMQVLQRFDASQTALREHRRIVARQHRMIDELTQKPWYPATMRRFVTTVDGQCVALVSYAGEDRLVTTQGDAASAKIGDTVFLSAEQNAILGKAPKSWISGQIGKVADVRSDGTVVVREHSSVKPENWG